MAERGLRRAGDAGSGAAAPRNRRLRRAPDATIAESLAGGAIILAAVLMSRPAWGPGPAEASPGRGAA